MSMELYPLIFNPILQDRIWGGTKLKTYLGKQNLPSDTTGESWELSAVDGNVSVVANGAYAGKPLTELLQKYPQEILGAKVHGQFGEKFPLLFKFLDAKEDLSIQVHPNDELAKKRHNSFGKTEMWYVMQADEGSRIVIGFKERSGPEEYLEHLNNKNLVEILNEVKVNKGDVFFLETGTIHALGGGIMVAEIQQTSDITYRVYDWDRTDAQGKSRELHTEQALDAINYDVADAAKKYNTDENKSNAIINCPYFTTNYLLLNGKVAVKKDGSSFTVYICTEGSFKLINGDKEYNFKIGDTVLIPAGMQAFVLEGNAVLLEVYIS
jgi:mannose-6-phosphate isomerase